MKNLIRSCAILLALILVLGAAPLMANASALTLQSDGVGGYYVDLPQTGDDTLDLSDKPNGFSFKVYDAGGAYDDYPNNCSGTLTVTAHEGYILAVGGSGNSESTSYDYLCVYDSDMTTTLGSARYGGTGFTVSEQRTTGNVLKLGFISDYSVINSGFDLTVTILDPSAIVNATYNYGEQSVTVSTAKGTPTALPSFTSMFTLPEKKMFSGWQIGEDLYAAGALYTFTGDTSFTAVLADAPVVMSDGNGGYYAKVPTSGTDTADLSDRSAGFTLKVYDNGGPTGNYSNGCDGYLLITAPSNCILSVSGNGAGESVSWDYLYFYDGDTGTFLGDGKYGGSSYTVPELTTTTNALKIYHYTDGSGVYAGFDLTVTLIDVSNSVRVSYDYNGNVRSFLVDKSDPMQLRTFTSMFTLPDRYLFSYWENSGVHYAEGDSFTLTGDVTFTAVVEPEPVVMPDGQGGYYSRLPKTGTLTADLSDKSAGFVLKVYDDGGANGAYPSGCNGYLIVEAPAGYVLSVSGSVSTYKGYDYMYLYDGDTSTQIGPKYEGSVTMYKQYTTGNALKLYFYSYYGNNYAGVDLTVTVVDPADLVTISFNAGEGSGQMDDVKALVGDTVALPECAFTLPEKTYFDYYTDGTNTYHAGDAYTVTGDTALTAVYIEKILVTYTNGSESHVKEYRKGATYALATYDDAGFTRLPYRKTFKQWRNGSDGGAYAIAHQCTADADVTFTAEFDDLPILIEDDDGGYYALVPEAEDAVLDLGDKPNGFTLTVYDISKFNYYPNGCNGSLTIVVPSGYVLSVSGKTQTDSYYDDYVVFYDTDLTTVLGSGINNTGKYGGYYDVPELTTTGNKLKIFFTSDSTNRNTGFKLTVKAFDPATRITLSFVSGRGDGTMANASALAGVPFVLPECTFTAPVDEMFLYYTDGVNNYPAGAEATFAADTTLTAMYAEAVWLTYTNGNGNDWNLSVAKGSAIKLPTFDTYFTLPAKTRFLGWRESASGDVYQAGEEYIITEGTTFDAIVEVIPILVSDGAGGWYVNMPANDANTVDLTGKSVGFSFKVYDDGGVFRDYSASSVSTLLVKVPAGYAIKVSGSVATETNWDYLRFHNGDSTSGTVLGNNKYTGTMTFDSLTSSGNMLFIYFNSDSSIVNHGYELTVTMIETATLTYVYETESEDLTVEKNASITLALFEDLFTLPDGMEFVCWSDGVNEYDEDEEIGITGDLTLTAVVRAMPTVTIVGGGATLNDGSGDTETQPSPIPTGTALRLPYGSYIFNVPAGMTFGGWSCEGVVYHTGDALTVDGDKVITALWVQPGAWDLMVETLDAPANTDLGTITLTEDLVASCDSQVLTVPADVTVTIDLAGHSIDGSALSDIWNGMMIEVSGTLTIVDSVGSGAVTGKAMQVLTSASLSFDALYENFQAGVALDYSLIDERDDSRHDGRYAIIYCPTLYDAFTTAANVYFDYRDEIPNANDNNFYFGYNDAYVIMYADATIPANETWEIATSMRSIWFDLHGHTFDIRGTFTGGTPYFYSNNGVTMQGIYPADFHVVSTIPGVFRSSGNVEVRFQFATAGDEIYVTGGQFTNFIFIGGNVHITGGRLYNGSVENYLEENDLDIDVSGEPLFENVDIDVWGGADESDFLMTVNGTPRFAGSVFTWHIDRFLEKTYIVLNGGYFDDDPRGLLIGMNDFYVTFGGTVEEYAGQADWAYDQTTYGWRISEAAGGAAYDLNGNNTVDISDVTTLLNALTGNEAPAAYDLDRNGIVNISDVTDLLDVLSGASGGAVVTPEDTLTISRGVFKEITGYELPPLPGSIIVGSSDLRPGQHTVACFDITGDAALLATINTALQAQIGRAPDDTDNNGGALWTVEIELDGQIVTGQIWTMFDDQSSPNYTLIYVNFSAGAVSASYASGRQNFYEVTGILLPLLTGVNADDSYPYTPGDTSYCFDLISGDDLDHDTFVTLYNFLLSELSGWSNTLNNQGNNTDAQFTHNGAWIQIYWDGTNQAVYVNADMNHLT